MVFASGSDLISRTPTSLALDAAPLAPLFAGSLWFDLTGGSASAGAACSKQSEHYDWDSGTLSAAFGAGQVDLTGTGVRAQVHEVPSTLTFPSPQRSSLAETSRDRYLNTHGVHAITS